MTAAPPPCAILLAAGAARRYGSAKQLLGIDGMPMVRRAAEVILATTAELTVVVGANAAAVAAALADLPLTLRHNPDWAHGMGASIACGFRALLQRQAPPAAALLCLADQPGVCADSLQRLIAVHRRQPGHIIVSDYGEAGGPPCVFPAAFHAELAALCGDVGARSLVRQHAGAVTRVPMPEAALDIDTPADYQRLTAQRP